MSELCRWYRYTTWPQPINMRITRGWNAQPDICIGTCRTTWDLYNTWCRRLLVSLIVKCILKTSFEFIEEKVLTFTYNFYINLLEQNMKQFKLLYIKICRYKILMEKIYQMKCIILWSFLSFFIDLQRCILRDFIGKIIISLFFSIYFNVKYSLDIKRSERFSYLLHRRYNWSTFFVIVCIQTRWGRTSLLKEMKTSSWQRKPKRNRSR